MEAVATQPVIVQNGSNSGSKKTTLILIVVILVIAIVIAVWFYFKGKKAGSDKTNLNMSSPLDSSGNAPAASDAEIRQIAEQLYADMDGANVFGHDETVWNNFAALNDPDVIKVNNQFNSSYQVSTGYSFVEWVNDESGDYPTQAMVRLKKLNLN